MGLSSNEATDVAAKEDFLYEKITSDSVTQLGFWGPGRFVVLTGPNKITNLK
jgi:hypothetical protein